MLGLVYSKNYTLTYYSFEHTYLYEEIQHPTRAYLGAWVFIILTLVIVFTTVVSLKYFAKLYSENNLKNERKDPKEYIAILLLIGCLGLMPVLVHSLYICLTVVYLEYTICSFFYYRILLKGNSNRTKLQLLLLLPLLVAFCGSLFLNKQEEDYKDLFLKSHTFKKYEYTYQYIEYAQLPELSQNNQVLELIQKGMPQARVSQYESLGYYLTYIKIDSVFIRNDAPAGYVESTIHDLKKSKEKESNDRIHTVLVRM